MAEPGKLTAELRLWWRGELPLAVAAWFEAGEAGPEETRCDTYLLTGNEGFGIKRRGEGGGLEIKSLVSVLEAGLPPGPAELWIKSEAEIADLPSGTTLAVIKTRRLRRFTLGGERIVEASETDEAECEVELGTARAEDGAQWSSLCFEARATLDNPARILRAVWIALDPPSEWGQGLAASYPAWLERNARA